MLGGQCFGLLYHDSQVIDNLLRGFLHICNDDTHSLIRMDELLEQFLNGRLRHDTGKFTDHKLLGLLKDEVFQSSFDVFKLRVHVEGGTEVLSWQLVDEGGGASETEDLVRTSRNIPERMK